MSSCINVLQLLSLYDAKLRRVLIWNSASPLNQAICQPSMVPVSDEKFTPTRNTLRLSAS